MRNVLLLRVVSFKACLQVSRVSEIVELFQSVHLSFSLHCMSDAMDADVESMCFEARLQARLLGELAKVCLCMCLSVCCDIG